MMKHVRFAEDKSDHADASTITPNLELGTTADADCLGARLHHSKSVPLVY